VEKPEQLYYEQEGIIEDAIEHIILKIMEWTAVMNQVTCQKAKVCQEWKNWKRAKDSCEEDKLT
jgi:hypothetical protein